MALAELNLSACALDHVVMTSLAASLAAAATAAAAATSTTGSASASSVLPAASSLSSGCAAEPILRVLRLSANPLGVAGINSFGPFFSHAAAKRLIALYVDGCDLADAGVAALVDACLVPGACPELAVLDLTLNGMKVAGLRALCSALRSNTSVVALSLARNKFGRAGIPDLVAAARLNNSLQLLDLSTTGLDEGCAPAIASLITFLPALRGLRLAKNDFRAGTAAAVCRALMPTAGSPPPQLTELDLSFNPIRDAGAVSVAGAISRGAAPSTLRLAGCSIGMPGIAKLLEACRARASTAVTDTAPLVRVPCLLDIHRAVKVPPETLAAVHSVCAANQEAHAIATGTAWQPQQWPFGAETGDGFLLEADSDGDGDEDGHTGAHAMSSSSSSRGSLVPPTSVRSASTLM